MSPVGISQGPQKRFSLEESTVKLIKAIEECNNESAINAITTSSNIPPPYSHYEIMDAIRLGIDRIMGNGTSDLILKTMKLVYYFDEERIFRQPKLFVNTLVKLLGKDVTPTILTSILYEMDNNNNNAVFI